MDSFVSANRNNRDVLDSTSSKLDNLVGFEIPAYNSIEVNYTDDTKDVLDTVVYKDGVDTVATITATYPTTAKEIYTKT